MNSTSDRKEISTGRKNSRKDQRSKETIGKGQAERTELFYAASHTTVITSKYVSKRTTLKNRTKDANVNIVVIEQ